MNQERRPEVSISRALQANYEDYYADGSSEWRRVGALGKAENIQSLCGDLPQQSVVEIGAGEGSILQRLSELNFGEQLYALEVSQSGVDTITRRKIPRVVEVKLFDGYRIPYADNRFDIAILSHVLEHAEHPRLLLYAAARVARYLFVEVPLEDTLRLPMDFVFDAVGHINAYSPTTIRRLLQSCRLRILKQITTSAAKGVHSYKSGRRGLINYYIKSSLLRASPGLATRLFTYHGALLCERDE
jgi:ubiquinone/menaquinone biosynthesis C-methylase UbiE